MRFILKTLVDITPTGARRGEGVAYNQQQNYMSVIQTIGLRANPSNVTVRMNKESMSENSFGSSFKGTKNVWTMYFEIEYEDAVTVESLEQDFDFIPIITELESDSKLEKPVFSSKDSKSKNIIFYLDDK